MKYFNSKTSRFLLTISFVFSFLIVSAQQNGKIKGTITTSDGELAAGVNVILKSSKYWTVSDENGNLLDADTPQYKIKFGLDAEYKRFIAPPISNQSLTLLFTSGFSPS